MMEKFEHTARVSNEAIRHIHEAKACLNDIERFLTDHPKDWQKLVQECDHLVTSIENIQYREQKKEEKKQ